MYSGQSDVVKAMTDFQTLAFKKHSLEIDEMELYIQMKKNEMVMRWEQIRLEIQKIKMDNINYFISLMDDFRNDPNLDKPTRLTLENMAINNLLGCNSGYPMLKKMENVDFDKSEKAVNAAVGTRSSGYTTRSSIRKLKK